MLVLLSCPPSAERILCPSLESQPGTQHNEVTSSRQKRMSVWTKHRYSSICLCTHLERQGVAKQEQDGMAFMRHLVAAVALALIVNGACTSHNPTLTAFAAPMALPSRPVSQRRGGTSTRMQLPSGNKPGDFQSLAELASSTLATLARGPPGTFVSGYRAELSQTAQNPTADLPIREFSDALPNIRPAKPIVLYEFEACPFCRKVREALTMLDIDAVIYPCPSKGDRYRPKVLEMGGKTQFPYLMDPNTSYEAYESDDIVRYLFQTYGDGIVPLELSLGPLTTLSCSAVSALRPGKGRESRASGPAPAEPLELWGYESAPPVRLVREVLCELEVPYKSVTVARGSIKSQKLKEEQGKFQVPFLRDPNTGKSMFESADIVKYLEDTYGPNRSYVAGTAAEDSVATAKATSTGGPSWDDVTPESGVEGVKEEEKVVAVEAEIMTEDDELKA